MVKTIVAHIRQGIKNASEIGHHIVVLCLSAGIAISFPTVATSFLTYWIRMEKEKMSFVTLEIGVAAILIVVMTYIRRSWQDRRLAKMAIDAGFVAFFPKRTRWAENGIQKIWETHGRGRTVMVIGSSGYGTLRDQVGDLSTVLDKCLGANIMLVNPFSQGAGTRIRAIAHPNMSIEKYRGEVRQSIELLKRLKALGKSVKLKLYSDPPLLKLVILGDYLWMQHYHTDLDIQEMPEYVLRHNSKDHGLYTLCYQYFVQRWERTDIPEYDLDTDELVYRDNNGGEVTRERFWPEDVRQSMDGAGEGSSRLDVDVTHAHSASSSGACHVSNSD
ncbi:MAG: hypothetical protein ABI618_09130 [Nitrospirota bacterium]